MENLGHKFKNYLVFRPDRGGWKDLFFFLFLGRMSSNGLLDCGEELDPHNFKRRWLIFLSGVVQLTLLLLRKPLAFVGWLVEFWLNLLHINHNFHNLIINFIRGGKVLCPLPSSENFRSVIGFSDERIELDESIKKGEDGYLAALSIMAAKLAYENEAFIRRIVNDHWKMDFVEFYSCWDGYRKQNSSQAFVFRDKVGEDEMIVVAFRGTQFFDAIDWCTDLDFSWIEMPGAGKVHGGFLKALGLQKNYTWPKDIEQDGHTYAYYAIREKIKYLLQKNERAKFIVTGHSLGGALAVLFSTMIAYLGDEEMLERLAGVYTFGQPRIGDAKFGEFASQILKNRYYRYVYSNDIVPRVPYDDNTFLFKHFGTCRYFNSYYQMEETEDDEPNRNYFAIGSAIPMYLNSWWELHRSFTIVFYAGDEYKENRLMKILRVIGLIFPGLTAHCPQDYVNSTRLKASVISSAIKDSKLD